ncbi:hypothetical protein GCM10010176_104180 [Nonomuraea spiralis]|nr:hypothetical protein GCM10010176_104180 [Nonomuraea spiralis]
MTSGAVANRFDRLADKDPFERLPDVGGWRSIRVRLTEHGLTAIDGAPHGERGPPADRTECERA